MILRILKGVIRFLLIPYKHIRRTYLNVNNFFLPNYVKIFEGRVRYLSYPRCSQKCLITGLGIVDIGSNCSFGYKLGGFSRFSSIEIQPRYKGSKITIGSNVSTNNAIFICAANNIKIGNNTLIGHLVSISDHDAHGLHPTKRKELGIIGEVIIEDNVWIGNNVIILKNTYIGSNTIVAAGAVVTGRFPSNVVIGGIPAKIIKSIEM